MRNLLIILAVFIPLQTSAGPADPPAEFGLGGMVGSMVSVTGKYWLSKSGALDFGFAFSGNPDAALYADYLYHIPQIFGRSAKFTRETAGYFGGGGGIAFWDDSYECGRWGCDRRREREGTGIFLRGLVGFEWFAAPTRFGVFGELGPTVLIAPDIAADLDVGVGGRYYF